MFQYGTVCFWKAGVKIIMARPKALSSEKSGPLDAQAWVACALDALAQGGIDAVRVEPLAKALAVTKGSFYWHFNDRDDFVRSVVEFWSARFTDPVLERINAVGGAPRSRLRSLMRFVSEGGFARYDVSIRAWALQDPDLVAAIVKDVDERRLAFVGALFADMGFRGRDAEMRARACVACRCPPRHAAR